MQDIDYH